MSKEPTQPKEETQDLNFFLLPTGDDLRRLVNFIRPTISKKEAFCPSCKYWSLSTCTVQYGESVVKCGFCGDENHLILSRSPSPMWVILQDLQQEGFSESIILGYYDQRLKK